MNCGIVRLLALCLAASASVAGGGRELRAEFTFTHDFDVTSVYQQGFNPDVLTEDHGDKPISAVSGPAGIAYAHAGLGSEGPFVEGVATALGSNMTAYAAAYSVAQVGFHVDRIATLELSSVATLGTNGGTGGSSDYFILLYGLNSALADPFSKPLGDMEIEVGSGIHTWIVTLYPGYAYYLGERLVTVSRPLTGGGDSESTAEVTLSAVPEPSTLVVAMMAAIPLAARRIWHRKNAKSFVRGDSRHSTHRQRVL